MGKSKKSPEVIAIIADDDDDVGFVLSAMEDLGFHNISIMAKVYDLASSLFSGNPEGVDVVSEMRQKGKAVYSGYWLNMVLTSLPEEHSKFVIDDIDDDEINDMIKTLYIRRPNCSKRIDATWELMNEYNEKDIKKILASLLKKNV